jgi:hypothetical protein
MSLSHVRIVPIQCLGLFEKISEGPIVPILLSA